LILNQYVANSFSYSWYEFEDGSSVIEEFGDDFVHEKIKYKLTAVETELLIFCDGVRRFSEIRKHFSDLGESALREMLFSLKDAGLLYFNDDCRFFFVSVVSSAYKKKYKK
jgi:hypothetical protein